MIKRMGHSTLSLLRVRRVVYSVVVFHWMISAMDEDDYPSTRDAARVLGMAKFFTGKPCRNGHVELRLTSTGDCRECVRLRRERGSQRNPAGPKAAQDRHRSNNRDRMNARSATWRVANKARYKALRRKHYEENKSDYVFAAQMRKAHVRLATPVWQDRGELRRFYAECPEDLQVDHVIPLRGEMVCGLHVIGNLQYLSGPANMRKSNKFAG